MRSGDLPDVANIEDSAKLWCSIYNIKMDVIEKAKEIASYAHRNHVRNDDAKTPYVQHLAEVADLVRESGGTESEIAAAWLHDTVEDTHITIDDIRKEFSEEIAEIVAGLTDMPEWTTLSLAERKARQAKRVSKESSSIRRVKLADQASNVQIVGKKKLDSTTDKKITYIMGAKKIAEACKGVSAYLDTSFEERYQTAFKILKESKAQQEFKSA